jgi:hypothetical protein
MRKMGTGSGGGIGMNKNVQPSVRTGGGSKSTRPAGTAQIGVSARTSPTGVRRQDMRESVCTIPSAIRSSHRSEMKSPLAHSAGRVVLAK